MNHYYKKILNCAPTPGRVLDSIPGAPWCRSNIQSTSQIMDDQPLQDQIAGPGSDELEDPLRLKGMQQVLEECVFKVQSLSRCRYT